MKVESLSGCRRRVEVEVPAEAVAEEFRRATRDLGRDSQITGFRRGRAPASLVFARFRREIEGEVGERLVREWLGRALEEQGLEPIHAPSLENLNLAEGRPLLLRAVFDVLPRIEPAGYRGRRVTVRRREVTDRDVQEGLETLRRRASRFLPVEGRAVQEGDFLVGGLRRGPEAGATGEAPERTVTLDLEDPDLIGELRAVLTGMRVGEERAFDLHGPADPPDPDRPSPWGAFRFRLREIKKRELPNLDDEFARELGSFDTLEDLRKGVQRDLEESANRIWHAAARREILDQILAANQFDLPESLVEGETRSRVEDALRTLPPQARDPDRMDRLWEEEWRRQRPEAERSVKVTLLLEAIAAREGISAPDAEVNDRLRNEAVRQRRTVAALKEEIARKGGWKALKRAVLRDKALDFLFGNANISSEDTPRDLDPHGG